MMMRRRVIEKLRDGGTNIAEPRPIEIAKHDSLLRFLFRGFDEAHLRAEILPRLAIEYKSIDPLPKLRIHRVGKILLPPEIKWQIGIKMGKDNARQECDAWTFQREGELLGTNLFAPGARNMAMRVDPCFDMVLF